MKNPGTIFTGMVRFMIVPALFAMLVMAAGCGSETASEAEKKTTATRTSTGPREATEEYVHELAARRIGDPELVRTASVSQVSGGKEIVIGIGRPYTCHDGAVVGEMALFTQQTMGLLFKDPAVQKISITMYGATLAPADTDSVAMSLMVDSAVADSIDWFEFDHTNMLQLVNTYYMDPVIQQSYTSEGGSTEGTLSDLQQAGAAQ